MVNLWGGAKGGSSYQYDNLIANSIKITADSVKLKLAFISL